MYWPVNCASLVYKLYISFQTRSYTQTSFLWILFNIGIFKKVNLVLLAYQSIAGVVYVNCTTHLWHVPKRRQIYAWGLLVLSFMEFPVPTDWYFWAFFVWFVNYESYFGQFEICGQRLNIQVSTMTIKLPYVITYLHQSFAVGKYQKSCTMCKSYIIEDIIYLLPSDFGNNFS